MKVIISILAALLLFIAYEAYVVYGAASRVVDRPTATQPDSAKRSGIGHNYPAERRIEWTTCGGDGEAWRDGVCNWNVNA